MEKETERMVRLVKDLLVLSQLDYHQVTWRIEAQRLDELVIEVVGELQVKLAEKECLVTLNLPDQPVLHCFDRDKMKQVLINVVQNAFKYTSPDGRIDVRLEDTSTAALIRVIDDGIGIPAEDAERVFDRFYRVDKTRSRDFGGTGLGLSIAREIVEAHGGAISIASEPDNGTEVTISLPKRLPAEEGGRAQCESA
jgi:two-component system sensor histidine kinase VicK